MERFINEINTPAYSYLIHLIVFIRSYYKKKEKKNVGYTMDFYLFTLFIPQLQFSMGGRDK